MELLRLTFSTHDTGSPVRIVPTLRRALTANHCDRLGKPIPGGANFPDPTERLGAVNFPDLGSRLKVRRAGFKSTTPRTLSTASTGQMWRKTANFVSYPENSCDPELTRV
jgi:hypothetical protein